MFRSLLTPLTTRFATSISPTVTGPEVVEETPEDFELDARIDGMRNALEEVKSVEVDNVRRKLEITADIHRIIIEEARTKDVFRELDGFLVLVSMLSTLAIPSGNEENPTERIETTRLSFAIIAEAMRDHPQNKDYFESQVGYDLLQQAVTSLASNPRSVCQTMGYLLALALQNFSICDIFTSLLASLPSTAIIDSAISQQEHRFGKIRAPRAVLIMLNLTAEVPRDDSMIHYTILKVTERLAAANHRNQALLNGIGIVRHVFDRLYGAQSPPLDDAERAVLQKLLRRMLEMGASTADARHIYQRTLRKDLTIDGEILEVLRTGQRAKWPEHFSFDGTAALHLKEDGGRMFPCPTGFTFMAWIYIEKYPTDKSHMIFGVKHPTRWMVKLSMRPYGKLEMTITGRRDPVIFDKAHIPKSRWTHVTLVYHYGKGVSPAIRLFIDGHLADSSDIAYPRLDNAPSTEYFIGDDSNNAQANWALASAYLLSVTLPNDLPRFIHHLGPRYNSNFQAPSLVRFLTYEGATSLNIFLSTLLSSNRSAFSDLSPLVKASKDGLGLAEDLIVFALSPAGYEALEGETNKQVVVNSALRRDKIREKAEVIGDLVVAKPQCLDVALWKIGGAAVVLRLTELAENSRDLVNALSVLAEGIRTSWQNSEDMERIHGYDILNVTLRNKSAIVDVECFNVLFEFLGLDFSATENSTITNPLAYSILAMDFELWSRCPKAVQEAHFDHFVLLLETSKFKRFNLKQRLAKFSPIRKLLFVLQTELYPRQAAPAVIQSLTTFLRHHFSADAAIKPVISYLAANLHEEEVMEVSPMSSLSRLDKTNRREKAEQVLEALVHLLATPSLLTKFAAALPLSRVLLLLLGEHPSPVVAAQILILLNLVLYASPSFNRKFELVSGWMVLRTVLPAAWDPSVHVAAFDLLLGRVYVAGKPPPSGPTSILCPYILPSILASLRYGLDRVVTRAQLPDPFAIGSAINVTNGNSSGNWHGSIYSHESYSVTSAMEVLVEELSDLHSSTASFRGLFKSKQTTSLYLTACRSFVTKMADVPHLKDKTERLVGKVSNLTLMLALDNAVDGNQKRELLEVIEMADAVAANADARNSRRVSVIDPNLIPLPGSRPGSPKGSKRQAARMSLQVVGERTFQKSMVRISAWRKTIYGTEKKRLQKMFQDQREFQRQAERQTEWRNALHAERGVLARPQGKQMWRLDETEGPFRVRKKLEPEHVKILLNSRVTNEAIRDVEEPDGETQSVVQVEIPPWAEGYEFSATEVEDDQKWEDDLTEDKQRRVRHELEPGDVIQEVRNVTRVAGVDASPGLLILGKTHLYMFDGLLVREDGEIIEAQDAPKDILLVPGTIVELDGMQRAQRWSIDQVAAFSKRTCLFRDVALEIYMKDSRSVFIVFPTQKDRQDIHSKLTFLLGSRPGNDPISPGGAMLRTPLLSRVSARVFTGGRDEISTAQRKWRAREISNFAYISILNQASGRTRSDVTQYPVFPWVLQDYTSAELDLSKPETFRNLSRPMGALTPAREEAAQTRYTNLESVGEVPFHYGTHFSSSMIVCHFLIRLAPFTHMFKTLQGGDWDLPDRLFTDMKRAWDSASQDSRGDVRELIPEFYTLPEFLWNSSDLDFGRQSSTGERIHDVKLPPWAKQDPLLFVTLHRQALESDHVSRHLPAWIDLIWGCKQQDPSSFNVFHPLSYEGAIDLDAITDPLEREATVGIIHNFGQTPRKLFGAAHPQRIMDGRTDLPLGTTHGLAEDYQLLSQSTRVARAINSAVVHLSIDTISDRMLPCPAQKLHVPGYPHETVHWGLPDLSMRLHIDRKVAHVAEGVNCSCAAFADSELLITGSEDSTVGLWKISRSGSDRASMRLTHMLRGHTDKVTNIAASRPWSLIVSASEDSSVILWDLNRAQYVRTITHDTPVNLVAIHESTGNIASCSKTTLMLHTINARQIASLNLFNQDPIHALAFHEREWAKTGVLATGSLGTITFRTWNVDDTPEAEQAQWKFTTLHEHRVRKLDGGEIPTITGLKFVGESLYSGDNTGKVYAWELPD